METVRRPGQRPVNAITAIAGALAIILIGCGGSPGTPSVSILASSGPVATATAVPRAESSVAVIPGAPTVFDTRTIASKFGLPMKVTLPVGWKPFHDITGTLGLVHTGHPEGPNSTWWGPDLLLVEEARIHDPSDVVSSEPATPDPSRFVPWPADFFAYLTALPGVTVVSKPEPITVGGVTGTEIVVKTPPMHPLVWMNGDHSWLGGGRTGVESAGEGRFVVVKTGGHTLLVVLADDPSRFEARDAEVRSILDTISFK